jgi:hypothetical protein
MRESLTFCGRTLRPGELELMCQTAREFSALGVTEIARTVCELLEGKRPRWGIEEPRVPATAGAASDRRLPEASRSAEPGRAGPATGGPIWSLFGTGAHRMPRLRVWASGTGLVEGPAESRLWCGQVEQYHYLGCCVPFGANLRYWARNRERELACLLWTSPAWKMQGRDEWIGWSDEQRGRNRQSIVNTGRFLILPWVQVKSKDWPARFWR